MQYACIATLLMVVACAHAVDPVTSWSFEVCRQDPMCAARWQLALGAEMASGYEQQKFQEMMKLFLERREDGGVDAVTMVRHCAEQEAEPGDECTYIRYMWLGMLREAHICATNEEWVVDHGCHCMDGKHCQEDCADAALADLWSIVVVVSVVGIGALAALVWEVRKEEELSAAVEKRMARTTSNYYLATARLYVASNSAVSATSIIATSVNNGRNVQI